MTAIGPPPRPPGAAVRRVLRLRPAPPWRHARPGRQRRLLAAGRRSLAFVLEERPLSRPLLRPRGRTRSGARRPRLHRAIDALRIAWGRPTPASLRVQWWQDPNALEAGHAPARWRELRASGRSRRRRLRRRWPSLRRAPRRPSADPRGSPNLGYASSGSLLTSQLSHRRDPDSRDVRDRLGYAIRELYVEACAARSSSWT